MIKLVIFDLDGVLVDARQLHYDSLNAALASVDPAYVVDMDEHLSTYDGLSTTKKLDMLTESKGLPPDLAIYDPRHFVRPLGGKMYTMATVIWTRGCIFHCSYCANESFYKSAEATPRSYYRIKDPALLVAELAEFKDKFDLNFLMFVDDIWPLHQPDLINKFCELYKKQVNLPFSVNLQCRLVKEECFAAAVDAGLRNVCLGVESGSARIRKDVLKRTYKDEDVLRVMAMVKRHKIRYSTFNIIGLPFEIGGQDNEDCIMFLWASCWIGR